MTTVKEALQKLKTEKQATLDMLKADLESKVKKYNESGEELLKEILEGTGYAEIESGHLMHAVILRKSRIAVGQNRISIFPVDDSRYFDIEMDLWETGPIYLGNNTKDTGDCNPLEVISKLTAPESVEKIKETLIPIYEQIFMLRHLIEPLHTQVMFLHNHINAGLDREVNMMKSLISEIKKAENPEDMFVAVDEQPSDSLNKISDFANLMLFSGDKKYGLYYLYYKEQNENYTLQNTDKNRTGIKFVKVSDLTFNGKKLIDVTEDDIRPAMDRKPVVSELKEK